MTLDTQVNLAESDKGSFYNQKEWLEEYEYGKGMFCSEYGDDPRVRPIYIDVSCIMITYPISSNFCEKLFSGILLALQFSIFLGSSLMALQFSIFLASSFIGDFLFISFQQKNEIKKGNTLM